jgi:hypothetical protein
VAPKPDRELGEARACIDRGDERAALQRLNRARRGYVKQHDADGLEHLLLLADVIEAADERTRIGRDNLVYAIKQNLRLESRRRAQQRGEPWSDPYPDLQGPTEHTRIAFTRPVKIVIGVATLLGALVLVGILVASLAFSSSETQVTLRLVNDTHARLSVRGCDDQDCVSTWTHADLDPGRFTERSVPADDVIDLFQLHRPGGVAWCLPLRVHDAYIRYGSDSAVVLVARLSRASPCPGTTVLPRAGVQSGL